jgi:hypothetical protein
MTFIIQGDHMSVVLKVAPALLLSALLFSPAVAAPVGPNTMGAISDSLVIQVRDGGHGHGGKRHGSKGRGGKGHHGGNRHHGKNHGHHGNRGYNHHGGRGYWHGGRWHGGSRWVAGRTYYVAPPGWRQYGARPGNWQTLGCVVVNGFWFCP